MSDSNQILDDQKSPADIQKEHARYVRPLGRTGSAAMTAVPSRWRTTACEVMPHGLGYSTAAITAA